MPFNYFPFHNADRSEDAVRLLAAKTCQRAKLLTTSE